MGARAKGGWGIDGPVAQGLCNFLCFFCVRERQRDRDREFVSERERKREGDDRSWPSMGAGGKWVVAGGGRQGGSSPGGGS